MKPARLLSLLLVPFLSACLFDGRDAPFNYPVGIQVTGDSDTSQWNGYVVVTFPPSDLDLSNLEVHVNAQWSSTLRSKGDANFRHKRTWVVKFADAQDCGQGYLCVRLPLPLYYMNEHEGLVYAWQDASECTDECEPDSLRVRRGQPESRTRPADAPEDLPSR